MCDLTITPNAKEARFISAYLAAIDFTQGYDTVGTDLDEDCKREAIIDALAFYSRAYAYLSDDVIEQAGHDFWLSRNGHGTGFWDRAPEEYGGEYNAKMLQKWAEGFGEYHAFDETGKCLYS